MIYLDCKWWYSLVKIHRIQHIKRVTITICKLYPNKSVIKKREEEKGQRSKKCQWEISFMIYVFLFWPD